MGQEEVGRFRLGVFTMAGVVVGCRKSLVSTG